MGPADRSEPNGITANAVRARVLIVDDDARDLEALSCGLSDRGVCVRCAQGAAEATSKLRYFACDVALISLRLPNHGGLDVLRHIRRVHPQVAVVVLAGADQESVARSAVSEGAFDYILRPLEPDRVAECIRRATSRPGDRSRSVLSAPRPAPVPLSRIREAAGGQSR